MHKRKDAAPISWPAGSPDITSYVFLFLWGYVKYCVYQTPMADINDLKNRNETAIAIFDVDMLQHAWMELEYCSDIVRMTNGAYVECV